MKATAEIVLMVLDSAISGRSAKIDQDEAEAAATALAQTCAGLRAKLPDCAIAQPKNEGDVLAYLGGLARYHKALLAATANPSTVSKRPMTLTEKVLAARKLAGCAMLAVLVFATR